MARGSGAMGSSACTTGCSVRSTVNRLFAEARGRCHGGLQLGLKGGADVDRGFRDRRRAERTLATLLATVARLEFLARALLEAALLLVLPVFAGFVAPLLPAFLAGFALGFAALGGLAALELTTLRPPWPAWLGGGSPWAWFMAAMMRK